ncbi:MAG TPA: 16S rRNA (guanine(527)-N(7))-methyltransferase RsmG [Candidatus Angelobacter sp.]|nr:16S rRNA (guanine(527)-N(7))-methyltransferase RsmG [Candidatus Angelobacter sp.]
MYIDLLLKWNARINLTAVRDPEEMVTRHFGESFFTAGILRPYSPVSLIDLGSGAGFPGVPLAMLLPEAKVTLIESNQKKSTFLKEVIFALKLTNVSVFSDRGENYRQKAAMVTMRAVERFEQALPTALNLVGQEGQIALMIGESQAELARNLASDVEWREAVRVPGGHSRVLLVGIKSVKVEPNPRESD